MADDGNGSTKQRLTTALLRHGQSKLADIWHCDASEVGRRLNGQRNIPFDDFCRAIDELGMELVTPDQDAVAVPRKEWESMRVLAALYLQKDGEP